jgi:DNA-binding CsgD family transcriptional regulator
MRTLIDARPMRSCDLADCVELARGDGARGPLLDAALLADLLRRHLLIGRVIEERDGAHRGRIRAYGLSALVDPAAVAAARRGRQPDFVTRLLAEAAGAHPPLLDRRDGARLGPRGTREMVVLNFVVDASANDTAETATSMLHRAFIEAHSGYALVALTAETRPWERKCQSYRASLRAMGCQESTPDPRHGTQLFWIEAADVLAQRYHVLQPLFARRAGRLDLTPAQRDVLELASLGLDDGHIASTLGIAIDTVHKRWRSIHERVLERMPMLVHGGNATQGKGASRGGRGVEKRRALVEFARLHPEEFRP